MKRESILLIGLIISLLGIPTLPCYVQPVRALYNVVEIDINADGSITPLDAPIINVDNSTYTLTADVNITGYNHPYGAAVRINRSNVTFDGNGHTIRNSGGTDCFVFGADNITLENSTAIGFNINLYIGTYNNTIRWNTFSGSGYNDVIRLQGHDGSPAGNNYFEGNVITNGYNGVWMAYWMPNNTFVGNYIANNSGVAIGRQLGGGGATFYHNVIRGGIQAYYTPACIWDNGYPSGGNYWIGYVSPDNRSGPYQNITGGDGIGDSPKVIDADDIDHYPLLTLNICNVSQTPAKDNVLSTDVVKVNATVTHYFQLKQVILNCTYTNSSSTWTDCINMTNLEDDIWNGVIPALPVGTNVTYVIIAQDNSGSTISSKDQGYSLNYPVVIPEFSSMLILPLFMVATLLAVIFYRKKRPESSQHRKRGKTRETPPLGAGVKSHPPHQKSGIFRALFAKRGSRARI